MTIILNGTTGITTPDIDSTSGLDAADLTKAPQRGSKKKVAHHE